MNDLPCFSKHRDKTSPKQWERPYLKTMSPQHQKMSERNCTMRVKDATSAFQSVNGGGKGSPSDRPHGRPVSETFMKEHHAQSNWTNIVKTSKKKSGAMLASCPNNRAHRAKHSGEKSNVSCVQTEFIEVSSINKAIIGILS